MTGRTSVASTAFYGERRSNDWWNYIQIEVERFTGALCASRKYHPDMWTGEFIDYRMARTAKGICYTCPVLETCRDYALKNPDLAGIWGGLDERERRKVRRNGSTR